jgi:hypothetical protein
MEYIIFYLFCGSKYEILSTGNVDGFKGAWSSNQGAYGVGFIQERMQCRSDPEKIAATAVHDLAAPSGLTGPWHHPTETGRNEKVLSGS